MRTLKFEDVCNGSKKIGLNTLRRLTPGEWMALYINEQWGGQEDEFFSEGAREGLLESMVHLMNMWEDEHEADKLDAEKFYKFKYDRANPRAGIAD